MDKKLRERDLLWCRALVSTLAPSEIQKVTEEFNRIRPDKAVEQRVQRTGLTAGQFSEFMKNYVIGIMAQARKTPRR